MKLNIPEVLPYAKAYKEKPSNSEWGNMHVVLCDGNVKDYFVRSSIDLARESGDIDGVVLGEKLLLLSKTQRLKLPYLC